MSRRDYNQFCGLATALDAVGERWTLLIVRDLMGGPKRYSDLALSLHGIGTSLLAVRIKQLEADGVLVRRELPPPAASTVYELTPVGWELADALVPLALWGARHQLDPQREDGQGFKPEWSLAVLARLLRSGSVEDLHAVYEFHIDGEVAHVTVADNSTFVTTGRAHGQADAVITTDSGSLASLVAGRISVVDAVGSARLVLAGDQTALQVLAAAIPPPQSRNKSCA
jgi:DNA-binding HxlR family transcriptional regulator